MKKKIIFILILLVLGLASCGKVISFDNSQKASEAEVMSETHLDTEEKITTEEPASETETAAETATDEKATETETVPEAYDLKVHFIDVGQGDACLITCNGHSMLIDGGKSSESDKIYSILKNENIKHLDYIIATHPEADHIGGLAGALNYAIVGAALSPVTDAEGEAFQNLKKYLDMQSVPITVPEAGEVYNLGAAEFKILGPITIGDSDNNNSIVTRLSCGDTSILFTGDAEEKEEQEILASGENLQCTVLKVGHHGSSTSTSNSWLKAVSPEYAVISCGFENEYGHPTEEVLDRLKAKNVTVLRTDLQGDVIFEKKNGEHLCCTVEKNTVASEETESDLTVSLDYIVNTNTGKFHYPDCKSVKRMKEKNKMYFTGERQELINRGYSPCGNCHP